MSLFFRLIWLYITAIRRKSLGVMDTAITPFRALPNDLDVLLHMNNGRYFTLLDLGRVDLMIRCGLWKKINAQGWYPVVVQETMRFRRSLNLWQRFDVHTKIIGWDDKHFYLDQCFMVGETAMAQAVIKARFLKKSGGSVSVDEMRALANITFESPALPAWITAWSAAGRADATEVARQNARH